MLKFKKIGLFLLGITIIFGFNLQYTRGGLTTRDHNSYKWSQNQERPSDPTVDGTTISEVNPIGSGSTKIGEKSSGILHLPQPENYETGLSYAVALIQLIIDWTIGILSFVTLVFILYNGFLVLTSGSDSKNAAKGKKGLITAAIALAGIALSRLIISIIIRFIKYLIIKNI